MYGWTRAQFFQLADNERLDLLAYEYRRSKAVEEVVTGMRRAIQDGKLVDGGAFAQAVLAFIGD